MSITSNDPNPRGIEWWNKQIYWGNSDSEVVFPEEDYQLAALPKTVLWRELGKRLGVLDIEIVWMGRKIDMSAVSDDQLQHHISLRL